MTTKLCQCGSGRPRRPLLDAAGARVCYACDRCEALKTSCYTSVAWQLGPPLPQVGGEAPGATGRDYCRDFLADRHGDYAELM